MTFDFRGYGESTGEKEFDRLDTDLEAALDYMRDTLGVQKVFLVGASMGGTASLLVAERDPVAGVVSISSPATYQEIDAVAGVDEILAPKLFIASEDDAPARAQPRRVVARGNCAQRPGALRRRCSRHGLFASPVAEEFEQRLTDFLEAN